MQPALCAPEKAAGTAAVPVAELLCPAAAEPAAEATEKLREMLQSIAQGGDINATDDDGQTALMLAAAQNERLALCWLVAKGADVTLKNKVGKTAQDLARTIAQRELLDLSAKVTPRGAKAPALKDASSLEKLALVVRRSGNVNMKGMEAWALKRTDADDARLLFALGLKGSGSAFALYTAIMKDDVKAAEQLVRKNPKLLKTALSYAQSGEMVRALVAAGAKPKSTDLHAALSKDVSVARELIAAGVPIITPIPPGGDAEYNRILFYVKNSDIVDVLVQAGEDPNDLNPLRVALRERDLPLVRALLRNGAKADSTAFEYLFQIGTSEDLNAPDGLSVIDRFQDMPALFEELIKAGAEVQDNTWWYIGFRLSTPHFHPLYSTPQEREMDVEIIRTILKLGITPPKNVLLYFRSYHLEVKEQLRSIVHLLIDAGADPKAVSQGSTAAPSGTTTLMKVGLADAVLAQELIDAGVDPLARTRNGDSALKNAVTPEVVELLLSKGADRGDLYFTRLRNPKNKVLIDYLNKIEAK